MARERSPETRDTDHAARLAAWSTFLRAHARVTRDIERELEAEQDLSLADYDLLHALAVADGRRLRMSELAERLALSRSGATRLVIPASIAQQLGLEMSGSAKVRYADGRTADRRIAKDIHLSYGGRDSVFNAIVEPDRAGVVAVPRQ